MGLAEKNRQRILRELRQNGRMYQAELSKRLTLTTSCIVKHTKTLVAQGLVRMTRGVYRVYYEAVKP